MDPANTSSVTDDQELAKVLESMNQQTGGVPAIPTADPVTTSEDLAFEETTPAAEVTDAPADTPTEPAPEPEAEPVVTPPAPDPVVPPADSTHTGSPELDSLKKDALEELRPLVDKLDLPADEKFDTLLLLIRSTDDKTLLSAAHEAAKGIADETKRAQALLDVIKEIDYFSGHGSQPQ